MTDPTLFPVDVDNMTGAVITVMYSPSAPGAVDCVVSMRNAAMNTLGSFHVYGTGVAAQLSASIAPAFGAVRVKDTALTAHTSMAMVTITNTGDPGSVVSVSGLAFTGDFSTTQPTPFPVTQGLPVTVPVTFDPSAVGPRTGTLTITSADPTPHVLNLAGTGTSAIIGTTSSALGTIPINNAQTANVQITNSGTGPLVVTDATFTTPASWITFKPQNGCSGAGPCTFTTPLNISNGTPANVPFTCTIPNNPTVVGMTQTATVQFASDADSGTSTATVSCTAGKPTISIATTTIMFGDIGLPTPGASMPVTIAIVNTGNMPLVINSIALQSPQPQYTLGACVGCNGAAGIAMNGSATFTVTFTPSAITALPVTATILVNSNDPTTPSVAISASGRGYGGTIGVSPTTLAFGDVEVGQTSTTNGTVTISNTGNGPLTINSAAISGANAADFALATAGNTTISANSNTTYTYQCTPSAQGARTATLTIASSTFPTGNKTVALTCNGTRGNLTAAATIDVGDTPVGSTHTAMFTLGNNGNLAVTNITDAITPAQFAATGLPTMLASNGSQTITISFTPAVAGPVTGTYTITGNIGTHGQTQTITVMLRGNGQSVDYGFNPATIDFMSFRYDQQKQVQFRIENNGTATIYVPIPTYMPDTGQSPSDYAFTYKKNGVGNNIITQQTLNTGEFLVGTGTAAVLNRVGAVGGTLGFTTLAPGPIGTRTAIVTGTSTSADVTVPATLDFGSVDVDDTATPHTMTFQIKNSASGLLDLSSVTVAAGGSAAFMVTPPAGNLHLAMNETADITVQYTPTVDLPVNQFDTVTIVGHIGGILNGPIVTMTVVKGHPIDRHFMIKDVGSVPDTFRNPGPDAPVIPITIANTGEAELSVTMVSEDACDPAAWTIGPETTATIAGNSTGDATMNHTATFHVTFSPTDAGTYSCKIDLTNTDNGMPIGMVTLGGTGHLRDVSLASDHMDIGYTGVGTTLTAARAIHLVNRDTTHAFHVTSIKVSNPDFVISNIPDEIAAGADVPLDITFTPTEVNDNVTADATILLDSDEQPAGMALQIRAHAVELDVHGGGGCAAGGDARGGLAGALLALTGIAGARRRKVLAAAVLALVVLAAPARADNVTVGVFAPTPETTGSDFQLTSADVGDNGAWVASAVASYARNPMVVSYTRPMAGELHPMTARSMLEVGGAYAFLGRFEAGVRLSIYQQTGDAMGDATTAPAVAPASSNAIGDVTLHGKVRLVRTGVFSLGAALHVTVPTATGDYAGNDDPTVRALVLATLRPVGRLSISLEAGAILRAKAMAHAPVAVEQGSGFAWGAGATLRVSQRIALTGEVFGDYIPGSDHMNVSPVEALAGGIVRLEHRVSLGVAAGRGVSAGLGAPDLRGVVTLSFTPAAAPFEHRSHPDRAPYPATHPRTASPAPSVRTADSTVAAPSTTANAPSGTVNSPSATVNTPSATVTAPSATVPAPAATVPAPSATVTAPAATVTAPSATVPAPSATVPAPSATVPAPSATVPARPKSAADATFALGRQLAGEGKYEEACAAFEQSQRLDPQAGTQFNIAACDAKIGKLATAWTLYRELARTDRNAGRRAEAEAFAKQLAPRVPKLHMELDRAAPPELRVTLNGANAVAVLGIDTPVDLGAYEIVLGAPGFHETRRTIQVRQEGTVTAVLLHLDGGP